MESAGKTLIAGQEGFIIYTVLFNPPDSDSPNAKGPLSDKRVRQALNYAMDRETIIKQAMFGAGKRKVTHFPEWSIAYFEDLEKSYPFDLEKAKALLTEAGYPDGGFQVDAILTPSDPTYEAWATIHAADPQEARHRPEDRGARRRNLDGASLRNQRDEQSRHLRP